MRRTTTPLARNANSQSNADKEENKYEKKQPQNATAPDAFFYSQTIKSTISSYASWFTGDNSLSKKQ